MAAQLPTDPSDQPIPHIDDILEDLAAAGDLPARSDATLDDPDRRPTVPPATSRFRRPPSAAIPSPATPRSGLTCLHCGGGGLLITTAAQAATERLIVSARYAERVLVICPVCDAGRAAAQAWIGLPADAAGVRLDTGALRAIDDPAYDQALAAITELIADPRGWVTLAGGYGTGKTTLIYAALNHLADAGVYGKYITAPALLAYVRDGFQDTRLSPGNRLRQLAEAPVLAVDELDKYQATEYAEAVLFELFDARYRARATHATLIGYNLDGAEKIPPFLRSRICDGRFRLITLTGGDLRPAQTRELDPWDRGADD